MSHTSIGLYRGCAAEEHQQKQQIYIEELLLNEAIHIQVSPAGKCLNRDGGKGIPRCWTAALKRSEGAANRRPNRNFRRQ